MKEMKAVNTLTNIRKAVSIFLLASIATSITQGAVVYDQRPASLGNVTFTSSAASTTFGGTLISTSVTLPSAITFNKAVWSVRYLGTLTDSEINFDLAVYADNGGLPGAEIARESIIVDGTVAPVIGTINASSLYELEAVMDHPISLAAGNYWLSIQQTNSSDPILPWTMNLIMSSSIAQAAKYGSDPWSVTPVGRVQDLQLQDVEASETQTIPSPAGLGAVALAALTLLVPQRKRQSR